MFLFLSVLVLCATVVYLARVHPFPTLSLTLRVVQEFESPSTQTTAQPQGLDLPEEIRNFALMESEPFMQEELMQKAREMYMVLRNWDSVLFELQNSMGEVTHG